MSDYTFTMAGALGKTSPVHVWCPPASAPHPPQTGVHIHNVAGFSLGDLRSLGRDLDTCRTPRRLFVQWTPQGFGCRSLNLAFAVWLARRRWICRDVIDLMVHEPYLRWSARPARFIAALVHRLMLVAACGSAARVWVSTTAWLDFVRPFLWTRSPLRWLPLPAPAQLIDASAGHSQRANDEVRIGHFSMFSPLLTPLLTSALEEVLARTTATILLIGRGSNEFRQTLIAGRPDAAGRVLSTGASSPADVRTAITSCDLMLQPYPDGVTSRRTSILSALALGVPTLTNSGRLTESLWRELAGPAIVGGPDGTALGQRAVELLGDAPARFRLGPACRESYDRLFDIRRSLALLEDGTVT